MEASETYQSYWVAYFDLLGFEKMVRQSTVCRARDCFRAAREEIKSKAETRMIETTWFSDTFLLYVKDESWDSCKISGAAAHFFRSMLEQSIAVRGCLAYGGLHLGPDGELFGPVLIDAYKEAEAQDWLGFTIHASAEERMGQYSVNGRSVDEILKEYDFRKYPVPFKHKESRQPQESQPGERDCRLAYTIISLQDAGKSSHYWATLDDMQANADDLILKGHDALDCAACEDERRRVTRKYENTKKFIRDTISKHSNDGGT